VQPVGPLSAFHFAAGIFVDDDDFAAFDNVADVAFVEVMSLERVIQQVWPFHISGGVEAFDSGQLFGSSHTFFGQVAGVFFFLDFEVDVFAQLSGDGFCAGIFFEVIVGGAGDDEWCAGFIDEDVVDFVDDGVVQRSLHLQVASGLHVVAEVVEAELIAGAVGDVAGVVDLSF
jgi:hypothetical protein